MDSCAGVEREVDKVLTKFGNINEHANRVLQDISNHVEGLKQEFEISEFSLFLLFVTLCVLSFSH